jgi:hypothetical protein
MSFDFNILGKVKTEWQRRWSEAKLVWSPFVKLQEPVWCLYTSDALKEGLSSSFAMIRLTDHRIVIDLEGVVRLGVQDYPLQILAHEIGHHIYTPANLRDNAVALGRIRWSLAGIEDRAPFVANIYEDILINDKLHRFRHLDMASVYGQLNKGVEFTEFWTLVMRSFEYLWKLDRGKLSGTEHHKDSLDADASLIASLVRSYSRNWMDGAGRFAALVYPYLMEEEKFRQSRQRLLLLLDAEQAGAGGNIVGGLAELDMEAIEGSIDPRQEVLGKKGRPPGSTTEENGPQAGVGPQQRYLQPGIYIDLQLQANPDASEQSLLNNYYREIALPHLVDFPRALETSTSLSIPEGTEDWDIGEPLEEIDWLETLIASPQVIPGWNTRKRLYGPDDESSKSEQPISVYIGVDCSGSMNHPRRFFSWPVLAATIIGLSALRAGVKVMGCLSGEPGSFLETEGFIDSESGILTVLTSYLGTGYSFGVPRLNRPFGLPPEHKSHIVLVTDDDIFSMLSATEVEESNWTVMERSLKNAGGSGSLVLHSRPEWHKEEVKKLQEMGWRVFYVTNEEELLNFATEFSKLNYQPVK